MNLKDLEVVNRAAKTKTTFEHAEHSIKENMVVSIAFTGATNKEGGQVNFRLNEEDVETLRGLFRDKAIEAKNELLVLGVKI